MRKSQFYIQYYNCKTIPMAVNMRFSMTIDDPSAILQQLYYGSLMYTAAICFLTLI